MDRPICVSVSVCVCVCARIMSSLFCVELLDAPVSVCFRRHYFCWNRFFGPSNIHATVSVARRASLLTYDATHTHTHGRIIRMIPRLSAIFSPSITVRRACTCACTWTRCTGPSRTRTTTCTRALRRMRRSSPPSRSSRVPRCVDLEDYSRLYGDSLPFLLDRRGGTLCCGEGKTLDFPVSAATLAFVVCPVPSLTQFHPAPLACTHPCCLLVFFLPTRHHR